MSRLERFLFEGPLGFCPDRKFYIENERTVDNVFTWSVRDYNSRTRRKVEFFVQMNLVINRQDRVKKPIYLAHA